MIIGEYKNFVKKLSEAEMDTLGDDYTSCWMFAYYMHIKHDLPTINYEPYYQLNAENGFELDKNGIYSYLMCHDTEIHHFILFVNDDEVIMMATYGGQKNIIKIKYDKEEFLDEFQDMMLDNDNNSKTKKYCQLFGIQKVSFDKLDMSNFTLSYTRKELRVPFEPPILGAETGL